MTRVETMTNHLLVEIPRLHKAGAFERADFAQVITDSLTTRWPDMTILEHQAVAKRLAQKIDLLEAMRPANGNKKRGGN